MPEVPVPTARADVRTASPERYAKQLIAHLGHRLTVEPIDGGQRLVFDNGSCDVLPHPTGAADTGPAVDTGPGSDTAPDGSATLALLATAVDEAGLDRVTDVVGRHLVRFGQRAELVVDWQRERA